MAQEKRKQSLYFPEEMLKEIQEEATQQPLAVVDRPAGLAGCARAVPEDAGRSKYFGPSSQGAALPANTSFQRKDIVNG